MNLTMADLAALPFPAAAIDAHGTVIVATPEWEGSRPGAVSYPVRSNFLVVATSRPQPACETVLNKLLDAIDMTATVVTGVQAHRVVMLGASLRIVAGRQSTTQGTSDDVLDFARAAIAARTSLDVACYAESNFPVASPEVAALVLVQFASNAERHAGVTQLTITARPNSFHVSWAGHMGDREVTTGRQRIARDRWGMGFARIAADAIGGAVYPPLDHDGEVIATLEVGLNRLALPLAAIRQGSILKATRPWDEETGYHPGRAVDGGSKVAEACRAALDNPGMIAVTDGWWSRATRSDIWIGIPPDDLIDRARDVLDGMVHERALWDGVPEPGQSRVFALASLLGAMLGTPLPRVPGDVWNRKFPEMARVFGITFPIPAFDGLGAVDPRIVAYLGAEFGQELEVEGDNLYLKVRPEMINDPFVQVFIQPEDNALKLT